MTAFDPEKLAVETGRHGQNDLRAVINGKTGRK
jgi:hypothetical protein